MSNWRDVILNDFVPNVSKLTLVADPDSLLTEEKLALELGGRGFDLIEYSDPVEFRYAYESKYRSIWDGGERTDLVVILRLQDAELGSLPYDLLQAGRKLSFNLGDLFPNLSYPVIEKLDRSLLDYGYEVWLTADHGNIECNGKGRLSEGVIAETRGERGRVYPTPELRSQVAESFTYAQEWQPVGLPSGYFPLVAEGHDAFVNPGEAIVGHGGIAIEEVIVPLVKIERNTR